MTLVQSRFGAFQRICEQYVPKMKIASTFSNVCEEDAGLPADGLTALPILWNGKEGLWLGWKQLKCRHLVPNYYVSPLVSGPDQLVKASGNAQRNGYFE